MKGDNVSDVVAFHFSTIRRQGVFDSVLAHQDEADGIAQRPVLVEALPQQGHRQLVNLRVHKNQVEDGRPLQFIQKLEDDFSGQAASECEGDEFRQNQIVCQPHVRRCDVVSGVLMLRRLAIQEVQQSRRVEQRHVASCVAAYSAAKSRSMAS